MQSYNQLQNNSIQDERMNEEERQNKVFGLLRKSTTLSNQTGSEGQDIRNNSFSPMILSGIHVNSPELPLELNSSSIKGSQSGSGSQIINNNLPNYSPFLNEAIQGIHLLQPSLIRQSTDQRQQNQFNKINQQPEVSSQQKIKKNPSHESDLNSINLPNSNGSQQSPFFNDESLFGQIQSSRKQKIIQRNEELKNSSGSSELTPKNSARVSNKQDYLIQNQINKGQSPQSNIDPIQEISSDENSIPSPFRYKKKIISISEELTPNQKMSNSHPQTKDEENFKVKSGLSFQEKQLENILIQGVGSKSKPRKVQSSILGSVSKEFIGPNGNNSNSLNKNSNYSSQEQTFGKNPIIKINSPVSSHVQIPSGEFKNLSNQFEQDQFSKQEMYQLLEQQNQLIQQLQSQIINRQNDGLQIQPQPQHSFGNDNFISNQLAPPNGIQITNQQQFYYNKQIDPYQNIQQIPNQDFQLSQNQQFPTNLQTPPDPRFYNPFQSQQHKNETQKLQTMQNSSQDKSSILNQNISVGSKMPVHGQSIDNNPNSSHSLSNKSIFRSQDKKGSGTGSSNEIKSQISESQACQLFIDKFDQIFKLPEMMCDFSKIKIQNSDPKNDIRNLNENLFDMINQFQDQQNLQENKSKNLFQEKLHKVKTFKSVNEGVTDKNFHPQKDKKNSQKIAHSQNIFMKKAIESDILKSQKASDSSDQIKQISQKQIQENDKNSQNSSSSIEKADSYSDLIEESKEVELKKQEPKLNLLAMVNSKLERVANRLSFADAIEVAIQKFKIEDEQIENVINHKDYNLIKNSQDLQEFQQQLELLLKENGENLDIKKIEKIKLIKNKLQTDLDSINEISNEQSQSSNLSVNLKNYVMKCSESGPVKVGKHYSNFLAEIQDEKKQIYNNLQKKARKQTTGRYSSSKQLITIQLLDKVEILQKVERKLSKSQTFKLDDIKEKKEKKEKSQVIEDFKRQILSKKPSKLGTMLIKRIGENLLLSISPASYFNVQGQIKKDTKKLCNRKQFGPQPILHKEQKMIQAFESKIKQMNESQKKNMIHLNPRIMDILKGNWKQNDIILETEQDLYSESPSRQPSGISYGSIASFFNKKLFANSMKGKQLSQNILSSSNFNSKFSQNSKNFQFYSGTINQDAISQNSLQDKRSTPIYLNSIEEDNQPNSLVNSPKTWQLQIPPLDEPRQSFDMKSTVRSENKARSRISPISPISPISQMNSPIIVINDGSNSQIDLKQILKNVSKQQFQPISKNRDFQLKQNKSLNSDNKRKIILVNKNGDIIDVKSLFNSDIIHLENEKNKRMVSGSSLSKYPSVIGGESYTKLLNHSHGSHSQQDEDYQSREIRVEKRVSGQSSIKQASSVQIQNSERRESKEIIQESEQDQIRRQYYIDQLSLEQINEQSIEDCQKSSRSLSIGPNFQPILQNTLWRDLSHNSNPLSRDSLNHSQNSKLKANNNSPNSSNEIQRSFSKFQLTNSEKQNEINKLQQNEINKLQNEKSRSSPILKFHRSLQDKLQQSSLELDKKNVNKKQRSGQADERVKAIFRIQNQGKNDYSFDDQLKQIKKNFLINQQICDQNNSTVNKNADGRESFFDLGQIIENMPKFASVNLKKSNKIGEDIEISENQEQNKKSSDCESNQSYNIIQRGKKQKNNDKQPKLNTEEFAEIINSQNSLNSTTLQLFLQPNILSVSNDTCNKNEVDSSVSAKNSPDDQDQNI